jgi:hypothetical protein
MIGRNTGTVIVAWVISSREKTQNDHNNKNEAENQSRIFQAHQKTGDKGLTTVPKENAGEAGGKIILGDSVLTGKGFESNCPLVQNDVAQGLSSAIFKENLVEAEIFLSAAGSDLRPCQRQHRHFRR